MRRFVCLSMALILISGAKLYAQQQMADNVPVTSLNANAAAAPQTGTAFAIPGQLNTINWTISFASAPASVTVLLETSNDNSVWGTADTSTATAGESRTIFTAARFVRATESARSGGGAITVTFNGRISPVTNTALSATSDLNVNSITLNASAVPSLRVANNVYIQGRNNANNAWVNLWRIGTTDQFEVSPTMAVSSINGTGNIGGFGTIQAGASGFLCLTGRNCLTSSANGLTNFVQNSGATTGVQLNVGTAKPTVGTCGTSPTLTATSTNVAGQITSGTGTTTCVVNFGAPAWTNTPFCTATDGTGARALFITAASTTSFTVNGLTASDVFTWTCLGSVF